MAITSGEAVALAAARSERHSQEQSQTGEVQERPLAVDAPLLLRPLETPAYPPPMELPPQAVPPEALLAEAGPLAAPLMAAGVEVPEAVVVEAQQPAVQAAQAARAAEAARVAVPAAARPLSGALAVLAARLRWW